MSGPFGASQFMYATSSDFYGHEISHSIRFDDGSSEYLSRTPGSAGNRKTMTWSGWFKRSQLAGHQRFFGAGVDNYVSFTTAGAIEVNLRSGGSTSNAFIVTNSLHRDVSAWYHIVVAIDTTQGTDTNRVKIYVNGVHQTSFSEDAYPSQNNDLNSFNNTVEQFIGRYSAGNYYDGYMAEVHFIDGLALTPASFGETKNDIWIPKDTSGLTYGTQGFRLQFKQSGLSANASGLGADTSGNTNHLNSVNHAAHDRVPDSPTNNFATMNSLDADPDVTFSEGNLKVAVGSSPVGGVRGTFGLTSGKWYWETFNNDTGNGVGIGVFGSTAAITAWPSIVSGTLYITALKNVNGTESSYGATYTDDDIIGVALNCDDGEITFYKNNASQGVITTIPTVSFPAWADGSSAQGPSATINFGQDSSFAGAKTAQGNADENGIGDFYYSPPSGFLSLCTANLPAPVATIDPAQGGSPQDYFNTALYTGTGSLLAVTTGFQPDWTWIKARTTTDQHIVQDSVRGNFILYPDSTQAEGATGGGWITETSTGFTADANDPINTNGNTYVAWNWKAGGSGSSNTNGTINTTATSVAAHGGFSISTYTGTGSNATVGHGLSSAPKLVIVKRRNATENWVVGEGTFTGRLLLDETEAFADTDAQWRDTVPSSTVVTIGTHNSVNGSSDTYVMYCFANVDGMQKIGQYTGNANADGTFVYTGFRPAFVLIKKVAAGDWGIYDSKRDGFNESNAVLYPSEAIAEENQDSRRIDLLSNGFKLRTSNTTFNAASTTIFMAFAEQPFKYANAR